MTTLGVDIMPRELLLLPVTWSRRVCQWNHGGWLEKICGCSGKDWSIVPLRQDKDEESDYQFLDSFFNEGGDIAIRFARISSHLTIPWRDFIHSSQSIMLFDLPLLQGRSFAALFRKMKHQNAHHIFRQFSLSTLVIHVHARCYTLSISKHGWIPHLLICCPRTIHHLLKLIFSMSHHSTATMYAYFRNGSIDIANMHSWTACIITTTTANHLFCPMTSPIISNYQSISSPSSGCSFKALAVFSQGMVMSCRNTKSGRYSWSCWICSAWQIFVFWNFETLGNGHLDGVLWLGCKGYRCTCHIVPRHYHISEDTWQFLQTSHIKSRQSILASVITMLSWSDGLGQFSTRSGDTRSMMQAIKQVPNWYCWGGAWCDSISDATMGR